MDRIKCQLNGSKKSIITIASYIICTSFPAFQGTGAPMENDDASRKKCDAQLLSVAIATGGSSSQSCAEDEAVVRFWGRRALSQHSRQNVCHARRSLHSSRRVSGCTLDPAAVVAGGGPQSHLVAGGPLLD